MIAATQELEPVIVRQAHSGDLDLVRHSWLHGYRLSKQAAEVPGPVYYREQHAVIERLIAHSSVSVCVLADSPDVILGCAVIDGACAHWIYVKDPFRRRGYCRAMLSPRVTSYSHRTAVGATVAARRGMIYNPYLAKGAL